MLLTSRIFKRDSISIVPGELQILSSGLGLSNYFASSEQDPDSVELAFDEAPSIFYAANGIKTDVEFRVKFTSPVSIEGFILESGLGGLKDWHTRVKLLDSTSWTYRGLSEFEMDPNTTQEFSQKIPGPIIEFSIIFLGMKYPNADTAFSIANIAVKGRIETNLSLTDISIAEPDSFNTYAHSSKPSIGGSARHAFNGQTWYAAPGNTTGYIEVHNFERPVTLKKMYMYMGSGFDVKKFTVRYMRTGDTNWQESNVFDDTYGHLLGVYGILPFDRYGFDLTPIDNVVAFRLDYNEKYPSSNRGPSFRDVLVFASNPDLD